MTQLNEGGEEKWWSNFLNFLHSFFNFNFCKKPVKQKRLKNIQLSHILDLLLIFMALGSTFGMLKSYFLFHNVMVKNICKGEVVSTLHCRNISIKGIFGELLNFACKNKKQKNAFFAFLCLTMKQPTADAIQIFPSFKRHPCEKVFLETLLGWVLKRWHCKFPPFFLWSAFSLNIMRCHWWWW